MKLSKFLMIAILSGGIVFTSCRDNDRGLDDDVEIMETETTDTELSTTMMDEDENYITNRIYGNRNLSSFTENMERNQAVQNWYPTKGSADQQSGAQRQDGDMANVTYTIFAPSNDAYNNLSETQRMEMMDEQNREGNIASINYLMVEERLTEEDLRNQIQNANGTYTIRTMQGENLTAVLDGDEIVIRDASGNEARIIETDTGASNGVIHVIDMVLMPLDPTQNAAANVETY